MTYSTRVYKELLLSNTRRQIILLKKWVKVLSNFYNNMYKLPVSTHENGFEIIGFW